MTQQDEIIERLSAENSAQHQEIISLRRELERYKRTVGDLLQDALDGHVQPWHEHADGPGACSSHPVENAVSATPVDGVRVR